MDDAMRMEPCPSCGRQPVTERTTRPQTGTIFVTRCPHGCREGPRCKGELSSKLLWNREAHWARSN